MMTAGQRNCKLTIEEHAHQYGLDDVLVALQQYILDCGVFTVAKAAVCKLVAEDIDKIRGTVRSFSIE